LSAASRYTAERLLRTGDVKISPLQTKAAPPGVRESVAYDQSHAGDRVMIVAHGGAILEIAQAPNQVQVRPGEISSRSIDFYKTEIGASQKKASLWQKNHIRWVVDWA